MIFYSLVVVIEHSLPTTLIAVYSSLFKFSESIFIDVAYARGA